MFITRGGVARSGGGVTSRASTPDRCAPATKTIAARLAVGGPAGAQPPPGGEGARACAASRVDVRVGRARAWRRSRGSQRTADGGARELRPPLRRVPCAPPPPPCASPAPAPPRAER